MAKPVSSAVPTAREIFRDLAQALEVVRGPAPQRVHLSTHGTRFSESGNKLKAMFIKQLLSILIRLNFLLIALFTELDQVETGQSLL